MSIWGWGGAYQTDILRGVQGVVFCFLNWGSASGALIIFCSIAGRLKVTVRHITRCKLQNTEHLNLNFLFFSVCG